MIFRALTGAGQGAYYGPQYALSTESNSNKESNTRKCHYK